MPTASGQGIQGRWTEDEDRELRKVVEAKGPKNWKQISQEALQGRRSDVQCLHRWHKVLRPGLVKGWWSKEEDTIVFDEVMKVGQDKIGDVKWADIAKKLEGRLGKQARERWYNHLDPTLRKDPWTDAEDKELHRLQKETGNKWCEIAKKMPVSFCCCRASAPFSLLPPCPLLVPPDFRGCPGRRPFFFKKKNEGVA